MIKNTMQKKIEYLICLSHFLTFISRWQEVQIILVIFWTLCLGMNITNLHNTIEGT